MRAFDVGAAFAGFLGGARPAGLMKVPSLFTFPGARSRRACYRPATALLVRRRSAPPFSGKSSHVYLVFEEVTSGSEWGVLLRSPTHSNASSPMHDGKFLFKNM